MMPLVLLVALLTTGALRGEVPEGHPGAVAAPLAPATSQSELDGAVGAFARAWLAEDMGAVAASMSPDGIRLQLGGEDHPVLAARQARAALEELHGSRSTRALDVSRVVDLGGAPPRGFAEIRWEAVVDRTSEPLVQTVFVSFERGESGWRIIEIRVL